MTNFARSEYSIGVIDILQEHICIIKINSLHAILCTVYVYLCIYIHSTQSLVERQ